MTPIELIHGEARIKLLFVNLTVANVLRDLKVSPDEAPAKLKEMTGSPLDSLELLKSIIYNGMKVYCEDYDKTIPYRRSELYELITKEPKGESNLPEMLIKFIEAVTGKKLDELNQEVEGEEKKMNG